MRPNPTNDYELPCEHLRRLNAASTPSPEAYLGHVPPMSELFAALRSELDLSPTCSTPFGEVPTGVGFSPEEARWIGIAEARYEARLINLREVTILPKEVRDRAQMLAVQLLKGDLLPNYHAVERQVGLVQAERALHSALMNEERWSQVHMLLRAVMKLSKEDDYREIALLNDKTSSFRSIYVYGYTDATTFTLRMGYPEQRFTSHPKIQGGFWPLANREIGFKMSINGEPRPMFSLLLEPQELLPFWHQMLNLIHSDVPQDAYVRTQQNIA